MTLRKTTLTLMLLSVVLCAAPLAATEPTPKAFLDGYGQWLADENGSAVLSVDRFRTPEGATHYGWILTPLKAEGDTWQPQASHLVQAAREYVRFPSRTDALRLDAQHWAVVADFHGGGTRILQFAQIEEDLFTPQTKAATRSASTPKMIVEARVQDDTDAAPRRLQDLCCPRLLSHQERTYIVASARYADKPYAGQTWIALAEPKDRAITGRLIGEGVDPRIVKLGSSFVCAVKALRENQTIDDAAPIRLYRSDDLQTWSPMASTGLEASFHDYDLSAAGGSLYLAGVTEGAKPETVLYRYDAQSGSWQNQGHDTETSGKQSRVRLVPASKAGRPTLVHREGATAKNAELKAD